MCDSDTTNMNFTQTSTKFSLIKSFILRLNLTVCKIVFEIQYACWYDFKFQKTSFLLSFVN